MGWFGADIMGGDPPWDWESNLICSCISNKEHCKRLDKKLPELKRKEFESHIPQMIDCIMLEHPKILQRDAYNESRIPWQVLGVLMLRIGASLPANHVERILVAIDRELSSKFPETFTDPDERRWYVNQLRLQVVRHVPGKISEPCAMMYPRWKCDTCGKIRGDAHILVLTKDYSKKFGLPKDTFMYNVKYCNDNKKCLEGAKKKELNVGAEVKNENNKSG